MPTAPAPIFAFVTASSAIFTVEIAESFIFAVDTPLGASAIFAVKTAPSTRLLDVILVISAVVAIVLFADIVGKSK